MMSSCAPTGGDFVDIDIEPGLKLATIIGMRKVPVIWTASALLVTMAVLMIGPARQDSTTVDETSHLAAGYLYWKGSAVRMVSDHPPLSQMVLAAPLLFMDVKFSDTALAILRGELVSEWMVPWDGAPRSIQEVLPVGCEGHYVRLPPLGDVMVQLHCPANYPIDNWYYFAPPESQMFGKVFVYDGLNDGDAMMFAGRLAQIAVTLLTGAVIFFWTRRATKQDGAALMALALWVFNPAALAHGHLTDTDIGSAFGMTLAIYLWARFLEQPNVRTAALSGAATGLALMLKFTAVILGPIFVVTLAVSWKRFRPAIQSWWKWGAIFLLAGWIVIMIVFFGRWAPAPRLSETEAAIFGIPKWFKMFRPFLIPPGFFKGIAQILGHAKDGHDAYLLGEWSHEGWWYYFPLVFVLKCPVSLVVLIVGGLVVFIKRARSTGALEQTAWLGAGLYLLSAMTSHVNIGIRHLLPIFPLLSVGVGCALAKLSNRKLVIAAWVLLAWQAVIVVLAYPLYLQFFTEAVGGAREGYKYLVDSNYDWGQDAKRLKKFLEEQRISHIYLDYFGTQFSIEHLKIPNTRVSAETAKQIQHGTLVVSVSQLMRPEWAWLRASRQPSARVAYTLFVYEFP